MREASSLSTGSPLVLEGLNKGHGDADRGLFHFPAKPAT